MANYPVRPEKQSELQERLERLGVHEADLEETFVRASGRGGQKLNKTSSCVMLLHKPTGISVKCDQARSQALNRFHARRRLAEKMEESGPEGRAAEQALREKIRKQKKRRSRRTKKKMEEQ